MTPLLEGNEDPRSVLIAREIGAISDADIVSWASRHAAPQDYAEDIDYLRLVRCNPKNAIALANAHGHLKSLITRRFPGFNDRSEEASQIAREMFLRRLRAYLQDDIDPFYICRMVSPIEERYEFPRWLGDLYNACDWTDERTTREQASHLREAIQQILAHNAENPANGGS
ncbi:MAG: hypothetical protein EOS36_16555 [Mesorhizobium sp.]|uniref:hypothetical protein n=1 Tax=Mesorhizobium sp. TaxID=1871066 RepID=UPI000FEA440B|nr:hypothetical protein [Mesorhizobium sp.]RWD61913.1 MAG: hypothetical protein EOS36_16555 [Mesorhizobium sp.]RWE48513.1 MAG: hypothetical protein EOS79_08220 [Mesorhizobium sp.]